MEDFIENNDQEDFNIDKPGKKINIDQEDSDDFDLNQRILFQLGNISKRMNYSTFNDQEKLNQIIEKQKKNSNLFLGAQVSPLDKNEINRIRNISQEYIKDPRNDFYLVCEKTDGARYLMYILGSGGVYVQGRKRENLFQINLKIPYQMLLGVEQDQIAFILDGEISMEVYMDQLEMNLEKKKKIKYRFLAFDCIIFNSREVYQEPYQIRIQFLKKFREQRDDFKKMNKENSILLQGEREEYRAKQNQVQNYQKIGFRVKDFFSISDIEFLFGFYIPALPHENDGLIFTRNFAKYYTGTQKDGNILKWKEPHLNTVDFLVIPNSKWESELSNGIQVLDLYAFRKYNDNYEKIFFDFMFVEKKQYDEIDKMIQDKRENSDKEVFGIIVECKFFEVEKRIQSAINQVFKMDIQEKIEMTKYEDMDQSTKDEIKSNFKKLISLLYKEKKLQHGWIYYKTREEKDSPNNYDVAKDTIQTLIQNINKQVLINGLQLN